MSKLPLRREANKANTVFCLAKNTEKGTYEVWKLCSNYDGKVRGGIRKTWRYVEKNMTELDATNLFERRLKGTQK